MGMFDSVFINIDKLPIPDSQKKLFGKKHDFQTKDLENCLTEVYITDDNLLMISKWEYETVPPEERPYPDPTSKMHFCGSMRRKNERLEHLNYNGILNFYTSVDYDKKWYEFNAEFVNGVMVDIKGGMVDYNEELRIEYRRKKLDKLMKKNEIL